MTGPEHYKEAERLLAAIYKISTYLGGLPNPITTDQQARELRAGEATITATAARAQVHATLALADATWAIAGRTGGE